MAIVRRSQVRPGGRRLSQRAPFPGRGANVQNRALSQALDPAADVEPPVEEEAPVSTPQPVGQPVPRATAVKTPAGVPPASGAPRTYTPSPMQKMSVGSATAVGAPPAGGGDPLRAEVGRAYRQHLGREGSPEEIDTHLGGAGEGVSKVAGAVRNIFNSPEAQAYRARGAVEPSGVAPPGGTTPPPQSGASGLPPGLAAGVGATANAPAPQSGPGYGMPQGAHWDQEYRFQGDPATLAQIQPGNAGALQGFDNAKLGDPSHNTMKYVFGRLASNYPNSPSGLRALVADPRFKAAFPNAQLVPGTTTDKVDFGDGRPVDVLIAADDASDTAQAWAWQTMDQAHMGGGGGGVMAPGPSAAQTTLAGGPTVSGDDTVSKLLQYLMGQLQI